MAADEVVLLAHMIGDGSCIKRQPIRYASIDEENLRAVANAAKHFGVTAKRDGYAAARVTTLRLPAPYHLTRCTVKKVRNSHFHVQLDIEWTFHLRSGHET
jgi:replicative DNA helicase